MVINCKHLFEAEGETLPIAYELPNTDEKLWKGHPLASSVKVRGAVTNRAGMVDLDYVSEFVLQAACDRCLSEINRTCTYRFSHHVIGKLEDKENDDYLVAEPDGTLDMDALAASDISLELPTKLLCRDDCKGLCSLCGKNLNEGCCSCTSKEPDSRFAKLAELLQKTNEDE